MWSPSCPGTGGHALEVPPEGGQTWFINMYRAYEALPEEMKERLDGAHMVHNQKRGHAASPASPLKLPHFGQFRRR